MTAGASTLAIAPPRADGFRARQALAPLRPPAGEHSTPARRLHALAKAVAALADDACSADRYASRLASVLAPVRVRQRSPTSRHPRAPHCTRPAQKLPRIAGAYRVGPLPSQSKRTRLRFGQSILFAGTHVCLTSSPQAIRKRLSCFSRSLRGGRTLACRRGTRNHARRLRAVHACAIDDPVGAALARLGDVAGVSKTPAAMAMLRRYGPLARHCGRNGARIPDGLASPHHAGERRRASRPVPHLPCRPRNVALLASMC